MAHLTKYKKNQLTHILKHDERAKDSNGDYIKFGNKSIDTSRTHLNYNLHERNDGLSDYEYILSKGKQHLAKNVINRDDVNWVGSWVVTLPKSLEKEGLELQRKFFEEATDFLEKRYGYDNIVGAYVHNDETTPHMHVKILPIFYDEKKKKVRMSAKDMFDIHELKKFHDDLEKHMKQAFGYEVGIRGNSFSKDEKASKRTLEELKQETLQLEDESAKLKEDNDLLRHMNKDLKGEALASKRELDSVREELQGTKRENEILQEELQKRDLFGRKKAVAEEISHKMELEISRRVSKQYNEISQELKDKSYRLKKKEEELSKREEAISKVVDDYNDRFNLADRVEKLERRNKYLSNVLTVFAKNVYKLSKSIFKEAIAGLKDFVQEDLLGRVGVAPKKDQHEHKR